MHNRIQKLLVAEYTDFNEVVLIESSFAQVTSTGLGLAEVQLGLTENNLIIAGDFLLPADQTLKDIWRYSVFDPEIESLELISVIPLCFLKMKLCARNERTLIKVMLATGRNMYFEFGEHIKRTFYINIWADRIFAVNKTKYISYSSSTSLASSSSSSMSNKKLIKVVSHSGGFDHDTCVLHKSDNYEKSDGDLKQVKSKKSLKKIEEKHRIPETAFNPEIIELKRRISKLNHNIQKQIQKVINENVEESSPLLDSKALILNKSVSEPSKLLSKPMVEIFKRELPLVHESKENIWV